MSSDQRTKKEGARVYNLEGREEEIIKIPNRNQRERERETRAISMVFIFTVCLTSRSISREKKKRMMIRIDQCGMSFFSLFRSVCITRISLGFFLVNNIFFFLFSIR